MAEPQNTFYENQRRFWILTAVILVVLLMLAGAGWRGRSAYRQFKENREKAQAQAFPAKGDYRSALLSARQTLQFNPTNVPACRVMAALAGLSLPPRPCRCW